MMPQPVYAEALGIYYPGTIRTYDYVNDQVTAAVWLDATWGAPGISKLRDQGIDSDPTGLIGLLDQQYTASMRKMAVKTKIAGTFDATPLMGPSSAKAATSKENTENAKGKFQLRSRQLSKVRIVKCFTNIPYQTGK